MPKTLWICRDRTGTFISNRRLLWVKWNEQFEPDNQSDLIEVPKSFGKGLKWGDRRRVTGLIMEEKCQQRN